MQSTVQVMTNIICSCYLNATGAVHSCPVSTYQARKLFDAFLLNTVQEPRAGQKRHCLIQKKLSPVTVPLNMYCMVSLVAIFKNCKIPFIVHIHAKSASILLNTLLLIEVLLS